MEARKFLHGVIPPMMTPVDESENIDEAGVRRLVERCIAGGVSGLFLLGSMGEGQSLVKSEKKRLIEIAVDAAKGRVPILAGVSAEGTRKVLENAADALDAGADYIVSLAPYYFEASEQGELIAYFTNLSRNISKPLVIYNNPYMTRNTLTLDAFRKLSEESNIVGVKDSGEFTFLVDLIREFADRTDFSVFSGNEFMCDAALKLGADGIVPGIGSLIPHIFVDLYKASLHDDYREMQRLQKNAISIMEGVYLDGYWAWVAGHKYALSAIGVCGEHITIDNRSLTNEEKLRVQETIIKFNIS